MLRKLKLGTQFTLLLTLVFLCGMLLTSVTLWQIAQREAEEDVAIKAEILTQAMNSVRAYTSDNIGPLLEGRLITSPQFIRETVPAFSARDVFDRFRDRTEYRSFFYKEATLNPTNVRDQADAFETKLIERFRQQPELSQLTGYRVNDGQNLFYTARPLPVNQSSCLQCHSTPAVAPKSLIATYGDKNGFGWKLHDVIAAQTVYVPADEVFAHGRHTMTVMMAIFTSIFAAAVLLINRLLKRRVIHPIRQLTAIARQASDGTITTDEMAAFNEPGIATVMRRADEPGQLARTFRQMAQEVADREQNLSQAVADRTAQLAESIQDAEAAKAKAEEANSAKSQFLSNMSHELRTPLNVILGFTQLMTRSRSLPPKQQEYLDTISRSGEHLLTLINDVLEMSKIEAGRTTLNEADFDLHQLLDALQQMLTPKAEAKGLQLRFERSPDLPRAIHTDASKLRQVLLNLLGNALKFTAQGSVVLRSQRAHDAAPHTLAFAVTDTGSGIAPSDLDHLFEPFVQAKAGRYAPEGTGLGLSISRQFVRLMGGEITVSSQVGVGTTFRFTIQAPAVTPPHPQVTVSHPPIVGLAEGQPTYRILIVEDIPENRLLLHELLTPVGFEVRAAANGQDAIAILQRWSPHLIWMDIRMPVMDGYEAIQRIKGAQTATTPIVIALTGSAFEEERIAALSMGFDDFVRKPFATDIIFAKMATHLGVRYRYAPPTDNHATSASTISGTQTHDRRPALTPTELTIMPASWIQQLQEAATKVNGKLIRQLLAQVPPSHGHLVASLSYLVEQFQFEDIMTLAAQALTEVTTS